MNDFKEFVSLLKKLEAWNGCIEGFSNIKRRLLFMPWCDRALWNWHTQLLTINEVEKKGARRVVDVDSECLG